MNEIIEENEIIRDPVNAPPPEVRPFTDRENSLVEQFLKKKKKLNNEEPSKNSKKPQNQKSEKQIDKYLYTDLYQEPCIPKSRRAEIVREYNIKLFAYWMDQLDENLSILRKSQIISALMLGHTDRYKLFKEKL